MAANKPKFYRQTRVIILLLAVFFPLGLWLVWRSGWSRKSKIIVSAAVAACVVFMGMAITDGSPVIRVAGLKTSETPTVKDEAYKLGGNISPASAKLTVNGEVVTTSRDGNFSKTINLKEGQNSVEIVATDGDRSTKQTYTIKRLTNAEITEMKRQEDAQKRDQERKAEEERRKKEEAAKAKERAKIAAENEKKEQEKQKAQQAQVEKAKKEATKPPHFADYLSRPIADIATEFGKTVDGHQLNVEKNGHKLFFENGPKYDNPADTTAEYTGKANIVSVELPELGTCKQSDVFGRAVDNAMRLTGLDPSQKGTKHEGAGGTQLGYGAYRNYAGNPGLELALLYDFNGDTYKLQLQILPDFR